MKWFKHYSDAHTNLKTQAVISELGMSGYGFWWLCVELVAQQGINSEIAPSKAWQQGLAYRSHKSPAKISEWLIFFANNGLIDGDALQQGILRIPKLNEYGDEYSSRKKELPIVSGQTRDNVGLDKNRLDKKRIKSNAAPSAARASKPKQDPNAPVLWDEYMPKMENDPRLHVQLIAYFFKRRGLKFDTVGEVSEAIRRHSRAATAVAKFGKEKVFAAMDKCDEESRRLGYDWTLDTVIKKLVK